MFTARIDFQTDGRSKKKNDNRPRPREANRVALDDNIDLNRISGNNNNNIIRNALIYGSFVIFSREKTARRK